MTRTIWWRVGLAILLAAAVVSWLVGYGLPDWMLADKHPVRNALEALSWPATVLGTLWLVVPLIVKKRTHPSDSPAEGPPPVTAMTSHHGSGTTIQAGRDVRGKTVVKNVPFPQAEPAHPPPAEPQAPPAEGTSTMLSHTGSGTTVQAMRDIRGGIRIGNFPTIPMPRSVRTAIIVTVVVVLAAGTVAAVVTWVLPEFAPTYKTEFLVDLSATGADASAVAESGDSLRKAIGNTGDDDAVALRTFGGQCGTDGNTAQVVDFGRGNRDEIGSAIGGASMSGAATLVRGLIGATEDFSGPFSRDAKQVNRIVVVTRNGVDACDDDAG